MDESATSSSRPDGKMATSSAETKSPEADLESNLAVMSAIDPQNQSLAKTKTAASEENNDIYNRFTPARKRIITAIASVGGVVATMASLLVLSAIPEVAEAFNTSGTVINYSNAVYMLFMAFSMLFWPPLSQVFGRKWVSYFP